MFTDRKDRLCLQEEAHWLPLSKAIEIPDSVVEDGFEQAENRAVLENLLPHLKERLRQVIQHRFFNGLTPKETGIILSVSTDKARRLEKEALRNLRAQANITEWTIKHRIS